MGFTIPPFSGDLAASRRRTTLDRPAAPQDAPERSETPFLLTARERRILCGALEFSIMLGGQYARPIQVHRDLQARLAVPEGEPDLSRPQELAVSGLEAKYGRYHVRRQADRSVVITGILDGHEMETVCVERDGTERWRRR